MADQNFPAYVAAGCRRIVDGWNPGQQRDGAVAAARELVSGLDEQDPLRPPVFYEGFLIAYCMSFIAAHTLHQSMMQEDDRLQPDADFITLPGALMVNFHILNIAAVVVALADFLEENDAPHAQGRNEAHDRAGSD